MEGGRAVLATGLFTTEPSAADVCSTLDTAVTAAGRAPRHIVSDQGTQFTSNDYHDWCTKHDARPRFGAVGQHGSVAVIERFIRSLKDEHLRKILLPLGYPQMTAELTSYLTWYNSARPHSSLGGATPDERLHAREPARARTAIEPRPRYPLRRPATRRCTDPDVNIDVDDDTTATTRTTASPARPARRRLQGKLELIVDNLGGHPHLPVIELREVA